MKPAIKTHHLINCLLYHLCIVCSWIHAALFTNKKLHGARYARLHELASIISSAFSQSSLLLGYGRFGRVFQVRKTPTRRELGNMLIVAPTRGGKGLLAVSQLLTWNHSVIVNDIKGDLFLQTAGYRSTLGEIIVLDPQGVGHRFDPLEGKTQRTSSMQQLHTSFFNRKKETGEFLRSEQHVCSLSSFLRRGLRDNRHSPTSKNF